MMFEFVYDVKHVSVDGLPRPHRYVLKGKPQERTPEEKREKKEKYLDIISTNFS